MRKKLCILFIVFVFCGVNSFAQFNKLYDFTGAPDGASPYADLILNGGFLYGMTLAGGSITNCANGCGTIFKIKADGTGYTKLFDFDGTQYGSTPYGSLICDGTYLYGMTAYGGNSNYGTAFKIKTDGTGYQKLYDFDALGNGKIPFGAFYSDGTYMYGMTSGAGNYNGGTIFKIKPDGTGYTKLYNLSNDTTGSFPGGTFVSDGTFLYAMCTHGGANNAGTIFKIKPDGTSFTKLIDLQDSATGREPYGSLIYDNGFLYGLTFQGGNISGGTIFKIKSDGTVFTKLMSFNLALTGGQPSGSLLLVNGFLYGLAGYGGTANDGVMFRIKTDGTGFLKLVDFTGSSNGMRPLGSLITDGNYFYGLTSTGGTSFKGTVFRTGTAIGVNEINSLSNINIYPNPFTNSLRIDNIRDCIITLYDYTGKQILRTTSNSAETILNTEGIATGFYLLRAEDGESAANYKLVKSR